MAERRMFSKTIIDSDIFLGMPQSTQALYFHLSMRADDEGFVNNPKAIMRTVGCAEDDISLLITKQFVIPFASGIIVIRHWKIHNYIQKDRLKETKCVNEKAMIGVDNSGAYDLLDDTDGTICTQDVSRMDTQVRLGKVSLELGKDSKDLARSSPKPCTSRFIPPTLEEVAEYCKERGNSIDPQSFIDHYSASNWYRGRTKIKDWKSCVRTWERKEKETQMQWAAQDYLPLLDAHFNSKKVKDAIVAWVDVMISKGQVMNEARVIAAILDIKSKAATADEAFAIVNQSVAAGAGTFYAVRR